MKKILNWIGNKTSYIVKNYFPALIVLAVLGIILAIIGHYGKVGFDWRWFIFFELPLYLFLSWASWKCVEMYKKIKEEYDKNRKK